MFKKFKDKLAEEMKQSPARLQASMQQLAQAVVSPALSNSSIQELSASNDNFSLTEEGDETPKNSPAKHGFQNVDLISPAPNSMGISRRSSVSSVTSDTSSLFPIYESPANLYHLQSDMDQSASEVDENINPQLEKVTKDQLYSAYRKVQAKYHKYRGRYTDLAAHYRELERVKGKLESVLVETQDKVLRRIADLKEQCQLEQQAKAHLEEALRNDIEEKDHIINTLNTKVKLLQANGPSLDSGAADANDQKQNSKDNLIDLTSEPASSPPENGLAAENAQLKDKLKKLENLVLKYKDSLKRNKEKFTEVMAEKSTLESEYETFKTSNAEKLKALEDELSKSRVEIEKLTDQVHILKKSEEESVISLAENKLSIHRELEDKEEQIKQLRLDLKHMTETKDNLNVTLEKYKTELEKLKLINSEQNLDTEKKEIIQDISRGKSEALKLMQQEMQQKLINLEEKMGLKYHEEVDRNKELSKKLEGLEKESIPEKSADSNEREVIETLTTQLSQKNSELQTLKSKLEELQKLSEEYRCDRDKISVELSNCMLKYKELKSEQDAQKIVSEEKKKEAASTVEKLQATVHSLDKELENMRGALMDRDKVCENFNAKIQEYATMVEKAKEKILAQETEIKNLKQIAQDNTELSKLQEELESKSTELLGLYSEIKSCKSTISDLKEASQADRSKIELLSREKNSLIKNILRHKDSIQKLKEDCAYIRGSVREHILDQNEKISLLSKTFTTCLTRLDKHNTDQTHEIGSLQDKINECEQLKHKYAELEAELSENIRLKSILESNIKERDGQMREMSIKVEQRDELESKNCKLIAEIDNFHFKLYDLEKLRKELEELKEEYACLKDKHNEVNFANRSLSEETAQLKKQLEETKPLTKELEELKQKFAEATEIIAVLQSKNADYNVLEEEVHSLRTKIEGLKEELHIKDDEITVLNEKLTAEQYHVGKLKAEYESQLELIKEYAEKLATAERQKQVSTEQYEKQIAEFAESTKALEKTINTKILQLKKLKAIKERQDGTIQELKDELNQIKEKNTELLESSKTAADTIEELRSKNGQISTLQNNIAAVTLELEQLKAVKDQMNLENKDLKDKQNEFLKCNKELQESSEVLKTKVEDYEKNNKQLLNDINELQKIIESNKTQLSAQCECIQNMESQMAQIRTELRSKDEQFNLQAERLVLSEKGAQEIQESLTKQNEELRNKISELNQALQSSKSTEENAEKVHAKLMAVEEANSKLKLELGSLNDKTADLEKVQLRNSELINEQISLKNKIIELENLNSDKDKLQSHVNTLESRISSLQDVESENSALKSELDALKAAKNSENTEFMSQISCLNVNNDRLNAELEELKHAVDEKDAELKMLDRVNSELLKEMERVKGSCATVEDTAKEVESLKNTIKELEENVVKKQSEIETIKKSNNMLQKELQSLYNNKTADESLIAKTDKLQEENKKLEAQLDEALITFQAKESQMQIVNNELKSQADKLREELKTNDEEQSMRLKQLVKEFQAQLHDKEEELQAALEKRFDRQHNYESNLIQQYKEQLKDFQVELTAKSEQIESLILENKELMAQKTKDVEELGQRITRMEKEHAEEIKEIERKWKTIVQQRTDKLQAKHEEEVNELTREWRNERRPSAKVDATPEELESTSRVAMAAVQSNTGSFHTLQQTLTAQRRELAELRKLVKLRHETLEDSTEIEYLRNILFEYMMGKETMVLARVIAAVVKFDQEQTAKILKKEEDKMTLLGSLRLT